MCCSVGPLAGVAGAAVPALLIFFRGAIHDFILQRASPVSAGGCSDCSGGLGNALSFHGRHRLRRSQWLTSHNPFGSFS